MVTDTIGGRRVVVSRLEPSERGRLGVDILAALSRAKAESAAVCFLSPSLPADEPLLSLTTDDVPFLKPRGLARAWLRSRSDMRRLAQRGKARSAEVRAAFWLEWYRELRRHIADPRLPVDLRGQLRRAAQRSFARWAAADSRRTGWQFPRAQLRDPMRIRMPQSLVERARADAGHRDIPSGPLVAVDVRGYVDDIDAVLQSISARGYTPVRLGDAPAFDLLLLFRSACLLCDNSDAQRLAYLTNTPTLTINATDAFTFYPIRRDGIYLLKQAVDLDSGRILSPAEVLDEAYYRNLRNYGYRDNSAVEVCAALDEMFESLRDGWRDTTSQSRYRIRVVEAGAALAPRVRHVAKWGPVDDFIGDGRIARIQADRSL